MELRGSHLHQNMWNAKWDSTLNFILKFPCSPHPEFALHFKETHAQPLKVNWGISSFRGALSLSVSDSLCVLLSRIPFYFISFRICNFSSATKSVATFCATPTQHLRGLNKLPAISVVVAVESRFSLLWFKFLVSTQSESPPKTLSKTLAETLVCSVVKLYISILKHTCISYYIFPQYTWFPHPNTNILVIHI